MFVKLTDTSGKKVCLNSEQILYIYESKTGLKIVTLDGDHFTVCESFESVCEQLEVR